MRAWWAVSVVWAWAGCAPVLCGEEIPITGDTSDPDTVSKVRTALESFLAWTDAEVCLREIELSDRLPDNALGIYWHRSRRIRIDPAQSHTQTLTSTVWHELCHVLDMDQGGALSDSPIFGEGTLALGDVPHNLDPSIRREEILRMERFAEWCERGPIEPTVAALEASCGKPAPARLLDAVWQTPPFADVGEIRITTSSEQTTTAVSETNGFFFDARHDRLLSGARVGPTGLVTVWMLLDDELQTRLELTVEGTYALVADGSDRVWNRALDGGPIVMVTAEGATPTQLPEAWWEGGYAAERLWLWDELDPTEIVEALQDGTIVASHPMPEPNAVERRFLVDGDQPAMWVLAPPTNRIVALPGGETLAELPLPFQLERQVGGGLAGRYGYTVDEGGVRLALSTRESSDHHGEIWLDPDGTVYASAACATSPERLGGWMDALIPELDGDLLLGVSRRWPVE